MHGSMLYREIWWHSILRVLGFVGSALLRVIGIIVVLS